MKEYKLKRWYPSIDPRWEIYHIYEYQPSSGYMCNKSIQHCVVMQKKELHPDFWELIEEEKPKTLFITEDGVEVFNDEPYIILKRNYEKVETVAHKNGDYRNGIIRFKHESNADEYIWRNKPVFSYHEIWKYAPYGSPLSIFEQLAKERCICF